MAKRFAGRRRVHVHDRVAVLDQVFDHREVIHWPKRDLLARGDVRDIRLARQPLAAVDDHAARSAHRDAAREAERDCRVLLALNARQDVEHRHGRFVGAVQVEVLERTVAADRGVVAKHANMPLRCRHASGQ